THLREWRTLAIGELSGLRRAIAFAVGEHQRKRLDRPHLEADPRSRRDAESTAPMTDDVAVRSQGRDAVSEPIVDVVKEGVCSRAAAQPHVAGQGEVEIDPTAE